MDRRRALLWICSLPLAAQHVPLPTFTGTLKRIGGKKLVVENEDGAELDFRISSKTRFFKGKKPCKASDLKPGAHVEIETRQELDASLEAVNVYVTQAPTPRGP